MTSPHRVGQTTAAEILVAHILDTTPAGTDTARQAAVIVRELEQSGWRPPHDPNDVPPLRPARVAADDSPGRREFAAARRALAERQRESFGRPVTALSVDTGVGSEKATGSTDEAPSDEQEM